MSLTRDWLLPTTLLAVLSSIAVAGCSLPSSQPRDTPPIAQQSFRLAEVEQLYQQAMQLFQQSRYGEAEPLFKQVLEIRRRVLGDNHPDTTISLNNLAGL